MLLITTGVLFVLIVCQLGAVGVGVVAEGAVDPGLGAIGAKAVPFNKVVL
jgi:hypothetical protein